MVAPDYGGVNRNRPDRVRRLMVESWQGILIVSCHAMSHHMRMQTQEITKTLHGSILVVTWEWNNGWNFVSSRSATAHEIAKFNAGNGLPVKVVTT